MPLLRAHSKDPSDSAARPPEAPTSLIPQDVLQDYEREVADEEMAEAERLRAEALAEERNVSDTRTDNNPLYLTQAPAPADLARQTLASVPIFSGLAEASLHVLIKDALRCDVSAGDFLFLEGDRADSFYVVLDGTLEILRRKDEREVALRHMGRGETVGLFGLFSGQQRAACARAIGDAVVLEVPAQAIQRLVERDNVLNERLLAYYQERLLEGFTGSSRLFSDVDSIARARIIGHFRERRLTAGEVLLQPGEVASFLVIVTHGALVLEDRPKAGQARHFEVVQGQFLAVTCAMTGFPSKLKVSAPEQTSVALLGHKELTELIRDYPALRGWTKKLPSLSKQLDRDIYCGSTGVPGL